MSAVPKAYSAITTETINIGRSEATTLAELPSATHYITWKMDLNAATVNIKPPQQVDLYEKYIKVGTSALCFVCNINTDSLTKVIEIYSTAVAVTKTTDFSGGVLTYTIPATAAVIVNSLTITAAVPVTLKVN